MPPDPSDDPFADDPAPAAERIADVTSRILAKHGALKAGRGGTSRLERIRAEAAQASTVDAPAGPAGPRPDVVIGIIVGNGWIEPERIDELRDFFRVKGVTQVLQKNGRVSGLLVDRGLLEPHLARELELTLFDQGIFPRYRITRLLGQGLVGRTYVAVDLSTGVDVAFKVFRQPDPQLRQLFLEDFTALERIRTRRIAQALSCGFQCETCFAASTLIAGERLSRMIAERLIQSEVQAARIALQIAEGLAYVSITASLCHRALRPENVLVQEQGTKHLSVVITDFGVAQQIPPSRSVDRAWQAPDCEAAEPSDVRPDIFAVGAILYNMLGAIAGVGEPDGDSGRGEIDLTPFHALTREVVLGATRPDPNERYRDYRSLISALSGLVKELGFVEPDEVPPTVGGAAEGPGTMFLRRTLAPRQTEHRDDWVD